LANFTAFVVPGYLVVFFSHTTLVIAAEFAAEQACQRQVVVLTQNPGCNPE
jgi:hypothetical protein